MLLAEPSGIPGGVLTIDELPVIPARCDPHVFGESGGATAFLIRLELNGKPGDLILRMSPVGAKAAIDYAVSSCGLG